MIRSHSSFTAASLLLLATLMQGRQTASGLLQRDMPARGPSASGRELWLGGISPLMQRARKINDPSDFMEVFAPNAPWPAGRAHLAMFKIPSQAVEFSTDAEMHTILDGLRRNHIGLSVEMGLLLDGPNGCGKGFEGMGAAHEPENVIRRIHALGATIDSIDMDEPVIFGHILTVGMNGKTPGCRYSIPEMVGQVAPKIEQLRQAFPNIKVNDGEAIGGGPKGAQAMEDILAFETLLHQRTGGFAPYAVHADMQWNDVGVVPQLERLSRRMHAQHIRIGIICDGGGKGITTSVAWVNNAVERCQTLAANPAIAPDDLLAQTWELLPQKMLPENAPGTLTNELKRLAAIP